MTFYELSPTIQQENSHLQHQGKTHEDMRMNYSQRLKTARKMAGLTQAELARAVGIDQTSVSNLERGRSQGSSHTVSLAKACGVNPAWLESGSGGMTDDFREYRRPVPAGVSMVPAVNLFDTDSPLDQSEVYLPFLEEDSASLGQALGSGLDLPAGIAVAKSRRIRFDVEVLKRQGISSDVAFCVEVVGNGMEPVLPSWSTVAINTSVTDIDDGRMYVIAHDGQLRVKLLYRLPGHGMRLRSYKRDDHPDEEYSSSEISASKIVILGRVFWYSVIL